MVIYILTKFGADWFIFVDALVKIKSNTLSHLHQRQVTLLVGSETLLSYILTMFGADCITFVEIKEYTKSNIGIFLNSKADNFDGSGLTLIIHLCDLMII